MRIQAISFLFLLVVALAAGGCDLSSSWPSQGDDGPAKPLVAQARPPRSSAYARFEDEDPSVRMEAVLEAGRRKDETAVPYLIDRLTDSEPEVRFGAIQALERITGTTRGYRHFGTLDEREAAALRWRRWWEQTRAGKASSPPAGSAPATRPVASGPSGPPASAPAPAATMRAKEGGP